MLTYAATVLALGIALAPQPQKVVLPSKYLGPITFDHPAHVALRIACKSCHTGVATKFGGFTPQQAHSTCKGCHEEQKRGPTDCRDCHRAPAPGDAPAVTAAADAPAADEGASTAKPAPATPAPATPAPEAAASTAPTPSAASAASTPATDSAATTPAADPAATSSAADAAAAAAVTAEVTAGADAAAAEAAASASPPPSETVVAVLPPAASPAVRYSGLGTVEMGFVVPGSSGGASSGLSFALKYRAAPLVFSQGIDVGFDSDGWRGLALWGAGVGTPFRQRWNAVASVVAGIDVNHQLSTDVRPALGGRIALEWPKTVGPFGPFLGSFTVTSDLYRPSGANDTGVVTASLSITAGVMTQPRRAYR